MKITRVNNNEIKYQEFNLPELITNSEDFEKIVNGYVVNRQMLKTAEAIANTEARINSTCDKIGKLEDEHTEILDRISSINKDLSKPKLTAKVKKDLLKEQEKTEIELTLKLEEIASNKKDLASLEEKLAKSKKLLEDLTKLSATLPALNDEESTENDVFKTYAKYFSLLWEKSYYTDEKGKKHQRFVKGFEKLFTTCVDYVEKYAPTNEEWTKTRINEYNDIRGQVNSIGTSISSDGNENIKPYHFTIRNKDMHKLLTLATKYYALGKKSVVEKVKSSARDEFHTQLLFILLWYTDTKSINTALEI